MAADLYLHALTTDKEVEAYKQMCRNTIGSKYFSWGALMGTRMDFDAHKIISETESVWIGEVSWLKAALFEDGEDDFVPGVVQAVADAVGEDFPVIDDELIAKINAAYDAGNTTGYEVADSSQVLWWLEEQRGKRVCGISW